jgi:hypothetical protein
MSPDTAGSDAGQSMITFTFAGTGFVSRASRIHWLPSIEDDIDLASPDESDNLERNVRRRLNGRVRDFRMLFQDNGLILQGHAFTYYAKQLAQHSIMKATRLPILANEIEVRAFSCKSC